MFTFYIFYVFLWFLIFYRCLFIFVLAFYGHFEGSNLLNCISLGSTEVERLTGLHIWRLELGCIAWSVGLGWGWTGFGVGAARRLEFVTSLFFGFFLSFSWIFLNSFFGWVILSCKLGSLDDSMLKIIMAPPQVPSGCRTQILGLAFSSGSYFAKS